MKLCIINTPLELFKITSNDLESNYVNDAINETFYFPKNLPDDRTSYINTFICT